MSFNSFIPAVLHQVLCTPGCLILISLTPLLHCSAAVTSLGLCSTSSTSIQYSNEFSSQNFDFSVCPSKNVVKHDVFGKKGLLSCCKFFLTRLVLIWPISSLKIFQNVQKCVFCEQFWELMGQDIRLYLKCQLGNSKCS